MTILFALFINLKLILIEIKWSSDMYAGDMLNCWSKKISECCMSIEMRLRISDWQRLAEQRFTNILLKKKSGNNIFNKTAHKFFSYNMYYFIFGFNFCILKNIRYIVLELVVLLDQGIWSIKKFFFHKEIWWENCVF